jgi:hypothetical protein
MGSAATSRWQNNERGWAKVLCKYGLNAKRITRAGNYAQSIDDVSIEELPWTSNDAKYSIKGWVGNRLLSEIEYKYCKEKGDTAILITKGYKERGAMASVDAEFLAMLLAFYAGVGTKESLWAIYTRQTSKETKE